MGESSVGTHSWYPLCRHAPPHLWHPLPAQLLAFDLRGVELSGAIVKQSGGWVGWSQVITVTHLLGCAAC